MLKIYPAIFHKEDGYWVEFPDLTGCNSCGSTIEETMELAQEALGLYLAERIADRQPLPTATEIFDISVPADCVVSYISTDVEKYIKKNKAVKKTISIPAWLADEAESRNLSLSKVLQDALKLQFGIL